MRFAESEGVGRLFQMTDFLEQGLPPVAGGFLDQSQWFLDAVSYIQSESGMAEREAMER